MGYAYADSQVQQLPGLGQSYFNTTQKVPKYWDGSAWQTYGSGNGTIQPTPQFRLFIQPNPGTQSIAGPASTAQDAVTPSLQGVVDTDLNGGTASVFSSALCTGFWGCDAKVPPNSVDTGTSSPTVPANGIFEDSRYGQKHTIYMNPSALVPCNTQFWGGAQGECNDIYFNKYGGGSLRLDDITCAGAGYNLSGPAGNSANTGWSACQRHIYTNWFTMRGIRQGTTGYTYCYGVGDCDYEANYLYYTGGQVDNGGEGIQGHYIHVEELNAYLHATIATGGTTGSNLLTVSSVTGDSHFIDGGFLLDTSKSQYNCNVTGVGTLTIASTTSVQTATVSGCNTTLPVSTVWGVSTTATVNYTATITAFSISGNVITFTANNSFVAGELVQLSGIPLSGVGSYPYLATAKLIVLSTGLSSTQFEANFVYPNVSNTALSATASVLTGQYQVPVQETVTFTIDPTSPNHATGYVAGDACTDSQFAEHVQILSVGAVSSGSQSVTFLTRYGYPIGAVLMQGGMCGQFPTNTANPSWKTTDMVVGSTSATTVIMSHCVSGVCNTSSFWQTAIGGVGSSYTFYPGAEIIGSLGGVANTVQLGYNTATWASGDTVESPHPSAVAMNGGTTYCGQITPVDPAFGGSDCLFAQWEGPATARALLELDHTNGSVVSDIELSHNGGSGPGPQNAILFGEWPTGQVFNFGNLPDSSAETIFKFPSDTLTRSMNGGLVYTSVRTQGAGLTTPVGLLAGWEIGIQGTFAGIPINTTLLTQPLGHTYSSWGQGNSGDSTALIGAGQFAAGTVMAGATIPFPASVTPTGTAGTTSYSYVCTALSANGGETLPSAAVSTTTGNATLNATNYNHVVCIGNVGDQSMNVYRSTNGGSLATGLVCPAVPVNRTNEFCNDTGQAAGAAVPTTDTSGRLIVSGVTISGYPTANGQVLTVNSVGPPATATWQSPSSGIANVQIVLPTTAIAANTCTSAITTTMTGVTTTSTFTSAFATDASGVTGYGSSAGLNIVMWPTANTNNLKVCNSTASSITPGAMTLNVGAR